MTIVDFLHQKQLMVIRKKENLKDKSKISRVCFHLFCVNGRKRLTLAGSNNSFIQQSHTRSKNLKKLNVKQIFA